MYCSLSIVIPNTRTFFWSRAPASILFIDEAQESMALGRFVRFMKEDRPCATVILSGSTLRRLFRKDTRYPVDRVKNLVLGPFSFSEYLTAVGKTALAADVLNPDVRFDSHQHDLLLGLFDAFLEAQPVDGMRVRSS